MPFEWFVALRYLREGKAQTALILGAVSIGVAVVIFLSALIGGLQTSLVAKTLGTQAHVVVHPPDEEARVVVEERAGQTIAAHVEKPSQRLRFILLGMAFTRRGASYGAANSPRSRPPPPLRRGRSR